MTLKVDEPPAEQARGPAETTAAPLPREGQGGPRLPYFDMLLSELASGNRSLETAFGRHVHWGYWADPRNFTGEPANFAKAAEQMSIEVCAAANVSHRQTVLDVGCGFGGTIASINNRYRRMRLTGLNIDPRQIARARATVAPRGRNTVQFVVGTASNLPFLDASCDTVLAVECIFHFPDRAQFFREAHRVLRRGGRLALTDYLPQRWTLPSLWWRKLSGDHYGDCDVSYTLASYRRLANETGFRPVVERDINANTIPTFRFLHSLRHQLAVPGSAPARETTRLYWMSRLGLWRYSILAFEKI